MQSGTITEVALLWSLSKWYIRFSLVLVTMCTIFSRYW